MSTSTGSGGQPCPCGQGTGYSNCCGRFHLTDAVAATATQLMRSRYSAYAVADEDYLLESWHAATRPTNVVFDPALRWTGLEIIGHEDGGPFDDKGLVEFRAHHERAGVQGVLHERSVFVREAGSWRYLGPEDASLT